MNDRALADLQRQLEEERAARIEVERRLSSLLEYRSGEVAPSLDAGVALNEIAPLVSAVEQSRSLLLAVIDAIPARIFWKDSSLRYLGCNTAFARDAGMARPDDLVGKDDRQMAWAEQAELYRADDRAVIDSGVPRQLIIEPMTTHDGRQVWLRTTKVPLTGPVGESIGVLGVFEDITEWKRYEIELQAKTRELTRLNRKLTEAQNQLLQSEKMAAVGQLAAGVAHEINNPIGFVKANLAALKEQVDDLMAVLDAYGKAEHALADHPALLGDIAMAKATADLEFLQGDIGKLIEESLDGVHRVKEIVENLRDFSRVDSAEWHFANLEAGLESTLNIVWNEMKNRVEVVKVFAGLPSIECIGSQLNQVFLNLLINAAQAIEGRGVITLRTGFDDDNVWVSVEDTGKGIRPDHLSRIFEPFFTTKPVGEGTGLGLSLAYGIVTRHGGQLEVHSTPGQGSIFRICLPRQRREKRAEMTAD